MRKWMSICIVSLCLAAQAQATTVDFKDPLRDQQWYLDALRLPQAWGVVYDQPNHALVRSAVLDTGFDLGHKDLGKYTFRGYNVITKERKVSVAHAHGTATLGLMAATSGNGSGITSAAITSPVLPIQITNRSSGATSALDIVNGIRYAADKGARSINISYTGAHMSMIASAAHYAARRGAVVFMSAGNDGEHHKYWANHTWVVTVGSTERNGQVSSFSSRGAFVDLVAPGRSILTTLPDDHYGSWSGTSFSSPLAASVAAMMFTINPDLGPGQVIGILKRTARDIGPDGIDDASGYGLIDAEAAVLKAINTKGKWAKRRNRNPVQWLPNELASYEGLILSAGFEDSADSVIALPSVIPEPGTVMLMLAGCGVLLMRPRRS